MHDALFASPAAGEHPYSRLSPSLVLDALASVGLRSDGRLMALNSYENRVYLAHLEGGELPAVVAKFYRPLRWSAAQIQEEHQFSQQLADAEIPVVAPCRPQGRSLHHFGGFDFSVSPLRGGRAPELDDLGVLEWIGRFLARIHTVGEAQPFVHRPALHAQTFGADARDWLLASGLIPPQLQPAWRKACDEALACVAQTAIAIPQAAAQAGIALLRLHGDCHPGNILWTPDEGPHFVDLDDARMGPAVQDMWMLVTGDRRRQQTQQWSALLDGYEQFRPFDRRELALIEPLRTLRLIHYSAWLARRRHDPAFQRAFAWFGSAEYWQGQIHMLHEQLHAMQQPPPMA